MKATVLRAAGVQEQQRQQQGNQNGAAEARTTRKEEKHVGATRAGVQSSLSKPTQAGGDRRRPLTFRAAPGRIALTPSASSAPHGRSSCSVVLPDAPGRGAISFYQAAQPDDRRCHRVRHAGHPAVAQFLADHGRNRVSRPWSDRKRIRAVCMSSGLPGVHSDAVAGGCCVPPYSRRRMPSGDWATFGSGSCSTHTRARDASRREGNSQSVPA